MIIHKGKQYTAEEFANLPDSELAGSSAFPYATARAHEAMKARLFPDTFKGVAMNDDGTQETFSAGFSSQGELLGESAPAETASGLIRRAAKALAEISMIDAETRGPRYETFAPLSNELAALAYRLEKMPTRAGVTAEFREMRDFAYLAAGFVGASGPFGEGLSNSLVDAISRFESFLNWGDR